MRHAREATISLLLELFSDRELAQLTSAPDTAALVDALRARGPSAALFEDVLRARPDRQHDILTARRLLHQKPVPRLTPFHEVNLDSAHTMAERLLNESALKRQSPRPSQQRAAWRSLVDACGVIALLGQNASPALHDRADELLQQLTAHRLRRRGALRLLPSSPLTERSAGLLLAGAVVTGALILVGSAGKRTAALHQQLRTTQDGARTTEAENAALRAELEDLEATQHLLRSQSQDAAECSAERAACSSQLRACVGAQEQLGNQLRAWAQMKHRITEAYQLDCGTDARCLQAIQVDLERLDLDVCQQLSRGVGLPTYEDASGADRPGAYRIPQRRDAPVPGRVLVFQAPLEHAQ